MPLIETLFIDESTGHMIGQVHMPSEQLPASFALNTTMHIKEEDWQVVKAEPMTADVFLQTGKLVLTLKKIVRMPIDQILFTLPTLCNEIPALLAGSTKQGKRVLEIHEDDWRQTEFISTSYQETIDIEIAQIKQIYQQASIGSGPIPGFKSLHIREHLAQPLPEGITLSELAFLFDANPAACEGVAYQHCDGLIEGGFAFQIPMLLFYGQQIDDMVKFLCLIELREKPGANNHIVPALQHFMTTYDLSLVDWCKPQIFSANPNALQAFLES